MSRKIIIDKCEDCPYYYNDKYNYIGAVAEHFCDFIKKEILDITKIPAWCKLEKA